MSTCGACGCVDFDALGKQIQAQDFDHCFQVVDGQVRDAPRGVYAPEVIHDDADDVAIYGDGWRCFTGMTGQYGYHGAVMHPSEYIGSGIAQVIAEHAADNPGAVFAIVTVEVLPDDDDEEPEPAGWAIAYRD